MNAPTKDDRILAGELAAVRGELARIDAKCGVLTGLAGAGLAFLLQTSVQRLDLAVQALVVAAAACWSGAALVLLVRVLRPHLGPTGFCRWAAMTTRDVLSEVSGTREDTYAARELVVLSQIVHRKYTALRQAVVLLAAGLVLVAAAVLTSAIT